MNNLIIKRSQIVEAQVVGTPATARKYQFLDVPNISQNNCLVYGLEVFTATQLATTPNNNTVIAAGSIDNVTVTLRDVNKREFIYQVPAYTLVRSNTGGFITMISPKVINLTDCYIQLTGTTGINTDEVLAANLYYSIVGEDA